MPHPQSRDAKDAERLSHDGFAVIVNDSGNAEPVEALVRRIEAAGGHAFRCNADVSDPVAAHRMFDRIKEAFGGVDVLVKTAVEPVADQRAARHMRPHRRG